MSVVNFTDKKPTLTQSHTKNENIEAIDERTSETNNIKIKTSFCNELTNNDKLEQYSPSKSVHLKTGYKPTTKIATTLQGSVYNAVHSNGRTCVLKRASVRLHKMGIAYVDNKLYHVNENIIDEALIMKHLTSKNPPPGLTKFIDFFCDGKNYFLLMEYGGKSLLKHVTGFHDKIIKGELSLDVWKEHIKILFKQMCVFINWLHNKAKLAHLDISLENMLIKDCIFENGKFISHGQINFIDFGLAKRFNNKKSFNECTKYVGKERYKAPKVYHKIPFNAMKADIWSLGVCLFMMIFGLCAYKQPKSSDLMFKNICSGYISEWANHVGRQEYVSLHVLDLLGHIFCTESNRWSIKKILKSKYVKYLHN